jgi:hypothetical protein
MNPAPAAPRAVTRAIRTLKHWLVQHGRRPRVIRFGEFRGLRMWLDPGTQTQVWLGLFEREVQPWLHRLSRQVRTAVDVGAAEGEYTLYFLARTRADQVIAVEPLMGSRQQLQANLALNSLDGTARLTVIAEAIGTPAWRRPIGLAELLREKARPCLVKIDVDGSELDILESAGDLITDPAVRWLIETHSEALEQGCARLFERAGRRGQVVRNAYWRRWIPEQRDLPVNRWFVVE